MKRSLFVALICLAAAGGIAAQSLEDYYDAELMHVEFPIWRGSMITYQGESYRIRLAWLPAEIKTAFGEYSDTAELLASQTVHTTIGSVLYFGGLSAYIVSTVWAGVKSEVLSERAQKILRFVGLGGTVATLAGVYFYRSATEMRYQAVDLYNRHKIGEYAGP